MANHHAVFLNNEQEVRAALETIGVDDGAYAFLLPKGIFRCVKLKDIPCRAANIIKQEMLSKGGEAALSRRALYGEGVTDVLVMGTVKQYRLLVQKLRLQPLGLRQVAAELQNLLDNLETGPCRMKLNHGKSLELGGRTLIMGILNLTPDSFYDGGRCLGAEQAVRRALEMREQGADIIDIGGVSTRPQADLAGLEEELMRVLPVVKLLANEDMILSIDTFRKRVAEQCLDVGAHIINNIGGLVLDPDLIPLCADRESPLILMHNRLQINAGEPYQDLIADIINELDIMIKEAAAAGVAAEQIIIDPGLGFGKTPAQNRLLVKHLQAFKGLGRPVLLAASRKSFIGQTLKLEACERLEGSLAVLAMGILNGADIVRVHDVKASRRVADMVDAIKNENG